MTRRALLGLAVLSASTASAQNYDIAWHTVDGGGVLGAAGASFVIDATPGQPDAGDPLAGGNFSLHGGFWALVAGGVVTMQADLSLTKSDSPDPVTAGAPLVYTLQIVNLGPSASTGMTLVDSLPAGVAFVQATPGPPICVHATGTVTCALGALTLAAAHTVTIVTTVDGGTAGALANSAAVAGNEPDPLLANNGDTEATLVIPAPAAEGELGHGASVRADLAAAGAPDADLYWIRLQPHASYEVVVDESSGDVGAGQGPTLERVTADGQTVLQSSAPVGTGPGRSLRFMNTTDAARDELVRVRSASCGTDCGADDVYRVRAWETTGRIPRFNNSASQVSVVLVQNAGASPLSGRLAFWSSAGALLYEESFALGPRALLSFSTATVPALQGQSGSLTVLHDGAHGTLRGKAVSLEPATGFSFDSILEWRPR